MTDNTPETIKSRAQLLAKIADLRTDLKQGLEKIEVSGDRPKEVSKLYRALLSLARVETAVRIAYPTTRKKPNEA